MLNYDGDFEDGVEVHSDLRVSGKLNVSQGITSKGSDFVMGLNDGKTQGTKLGQRAMVHDGSDALILNYGGDFEGGTLIQSNLSTTGNIYVGNKSNFKTDQGGSLELGGDNNIVSSRTPYIDFHSHGKSEDYNIRLINTDDNTLTVEGGNLRVTGKIATTEVCVTPNCCMVRLCV